MTTTPVLDKLAAGRIFIITKADDGIFEIVEACDTAFGQTLTKDELLQLVKELTELAES